MPRFLPDLHKNDLNTQDALEHQSALRRGRRSDLADFTRTADGSYVYTGATFSFQGDDRARRRYLTTLGALAVLVLAAALCAGLIRAPGAGRCFYIVTPYCLALVAACSLAWGLGRLVLGSYPLRTYLYRATVRQFPLRSVLAALGAAAAFAGECVYLCLYGAGDLALGAALYLTCQALILAGSLLWLRVCRAARWAPTPAAR